MTTVLQTIPSAPAAPEGGGETPAEAPAAPTESKEATTAPETTPQAVPEVPKAPESDSVDPDLELSRKFDAVAKKEAKFRRFDAELKEREAKLTARERELEESLRLLEDDPVEYWLKKGKDPTELVRKAATPLSEEAKRIRQLEERLEKDERERKEREEREATARSEQERATMFKRFVAETDPEKYPHFTAVHRPEDLPSVVSRLLNRPADPDEPDGPTLIEAFKARYNRAPSDDEIRQSLEYEAESYAKNIVERFKPKAESPQATPPETSQGADTATAPSLSNQHAANITSGATRNKPFSSRVKELAAMVEAEMASE